ncbi:ladderlectin-like isoform X3 [Thunnus maccoyii]|uniref:ladderlectin-like isoform X3 n=1 Tax=Thunnus maccoyii TaxID=8240 RepID=UPI001C4CBC4E|nr:ladderlectin-like isoform X3 [Thunnus maccoyii]
MKTVLVISILLCAAFAEAAVVAPKEEMATAPEIEEKMMKEEVVAEDSVPAPINEAAVVAPKEEMATAPEMEEKMIQEDVVAEDSVPAPINARFSFCPDGWFSYGSRCFKFVNTPMNWYNAEEHCNNLDAQLASATNPREYRFLQQMTNTAGQSIAWLGGFYLQGTWLWIDGERLYYTNWYSQASPSSCPCMYLRSTNGWGNSRCSSSYRFICSKSPFDC